MTSFWNLYTVGTGYGEVVHSDPSRHRVLALFPRLDHWRASISGFLKYFVKQKRFSVLAIAQKRHTGESKTNSEVKSSINSRALQRAVMELLKPVAILRLHQAQASRFTPLEISVFGLGGASGVGI